MNSEHPFTKSYLRIVIISAIMISAILVYWGLLLLYTPIPPVAALIDSIISTGIFAILSYLLWYAVGFINSLYAEIILTIIVMIVWLTGTFIGQYLGEQTVTGTPSIFLPTLPIRLTYGLLCWIIISQWYHLQRLTEWKKERIINENIQTIQTSGITDRIAVKDGSHIHIIHLKELIYIQACGDYVTLFTSNGEYLKEETMKYLESNLPADKFLRIHRSFIVNLEQIQQVELFGKETYHVLLKNGATLRASNTGYKLLKERLSL